MIKMWGTSMNHDLDIIHVNDHYEVYIDGKFYCSADTVTEAVKEVENVK